MTAVQLHGLMAGGVVEASNAPPHRLVGCAGLTAVISDVPDLTAFEVQTPEQVAAWALSHNAILSAYCAKEGLLPMQVGSIFSDDAAIRARIEMRKDPLLRAVDTLATLREYTLQLRVRDVSQSVQVMCDTGRDHLRARRDARTRRSTLEADRHALARAILDQIDRLSFQMGPAGAPKPKRLLDCVLLIAVSDVGKLQAIAGDWDRAAQALGLELEIIGPWPAYSFDAETLLAGED